MNPYKYHNQARISYVDLFKGCGILLMIMGHVGFGYTFQKYIHSFHMPMFFFISGFLFKKKQIDFTIFIKKKVKTLLHPYFFWGFFSLLIWYFFKGVDLLYLRILLWDNTTGIAISGALWFLTAMFISNIIFYLVENYISNVVLKLISYILIASLGFYLPQVGLSLPFAICSSFVGTSFMAIGYYFKQSKIVMNYFFDTNNVLIWIMLILGSIIVFFNEYINMRTSSYGNIFMFYTSSLIIILVLLYYSEKYSNCYWIKAINKIGSDSITFVCLNQIWIYTIGFLINQFGIKGKGIYFDIIFLTIVLFFLWLSNEIINKSKLRFLIGK
ncbi:acyltransferase family protein [Streptococcus parasuis]